ncbi:TlpA disulfide reductase family protein [Thalassotalea sp. G2M2-11]|uniref:TlpA family protein disulfide reductase n=1 Tax=Thalassotalea sp. G2M2-11 TaxID=2787627 RepID=UPI0019D0BAE0|nr:TlpA disulfide reductase family protein [Thalassotalea sp. G2M2-11]
MIGNIAHSREKAPDFSLPQLNGSQVIKLSNSLGKVVYLDFWASWCPSCVKVLPMLEQWQNQFPKKLKILTINVDENEQQAVSFLKRLNITLAVGYDQDLTVARAYQATVLPYSFIINHHGDIIYKHKGFQADDDKLLKQKLIEALKAVER